MDEITRAEVRKRLGNISQLRDLLLGDQIDHYNHRLDQYHQRLDILETNLQQLQTTMETCIAQSIAQSEKKLLEQLNAVVNTWEQKTQDHNRQIHETQHKIQQNFAYLSQSTQDNLAFLHQTINSINDETNRLKIEIAESKSNAERDLTLFKQELSHKLETHLQELATSKISRADLAEVLGELSLKLKGTNVDSHSDLEQVNSQDSPQTT